jgi:hypothetical protein
MAWESFIFAISKKKRQQKISKKNSKKKMSAAAQPHSLSLSLTNGGVNRLAWDCFALAAGAPGTFGIFGELEIRVPESQCVI